MKKLLFAHFLKDTLFFFLLMSLSLGLIVWVIQAVNYLDFMTEDGHGFYVYFSYTLYNFPKIIHRILPLVFFISLFYQINNYELKNELIIFWTAGVSKFQFIKIILIFSIVFFIFQIILGAYVSPAGQDKARNFIRNSNVDFFPSLFQEGKFIDVLKNLSIFIESEKPEGKYNNILVKYILIDKYRKNALEKLNDTIYENLLEYKDTCIYITKDNIIKDKDTYRDSTLKKYIDKIFEINKQFIQIFGLNSLLYDITKHDLTPECRILNDKEKETLLNKYSIVENDLPNILVNDALGSIYGVKVGDIIEETSPSATAGISKFYRLCIP